ncbi:hypothetical protein QJQ45_003079 [Haematococcus lacustris]|nr:hypothetical protein QJQ45_003079 [Haematococcus lacustris]
MLLEKHGAAALNVGRVTPGAGYDAARLWEDWQRDTAWQLVMRNGLPAAWCPPIGDKPRQTKRSSHAARCYANRTRIASPRSSRGSGPKLGSGLRFLEMLGAPSSLLRQALAHHNAVAKRKNQSFANLLKYNICCQCDTVVDLLLGNIRSSHQQLLELAELQSAARDPKNISRHHPALPLVCAPGPAHHLAAGLQHRISTPPSPSANASCAIEYLASKRSIVQHVVLLQHLNKLLGHIQLIIDQILEERKSQVISDEGFHRLLQQLQQQAGQDQMQLLATNAKHHYFMARQGRQLLEALASGFDKVEASVLLHGRLVDQNCFAHMLEALDSPADRDNVWHRIILARKAASHP